MMISAVPRLRGQGVAFLNNFKFDNVRSYPKS